MGERRSTLNRLAEWALLVAAVWVVATTLFPPATVLLGVSPLAPLLAARPELAAWVGPLLHGPLFRLPLDGVPGGLLPDADTALGPNDDRFFVTPVVEAEITPAGPGAAHSPAGLAALGGELLQGLVILVVVVVLYLLVRSLRRGNAFTARNHKLVLAAAITVAVGGELAAALRTLGTVLIARDPDIGPMVSWTWDVSLVPLGIGILIGLASRLFAEGAELREDVDATV